MSVYPWVRPDVDLSTIPNPPNQPLFLQIDAFQNTPPGIGHASRRSCIEDRPVCKIFGFEHTGTQGLRLNEQPPGLASQHGNINGGSPLGVRLLRNSDG